MTRLRGSARNDNLRFLRAACVLAIASACARPARSAAVVEFHKATAPGDARLGEVSVHPLDRDLLAAVESSRPSVEDWQRILSIRVAVDAKADTNDASAALPLLGTYAVAADTLRFRPRFPPAPGIAYEARFDAAALHAHVRRTPAAGLAGVTTSRWVFDLPASAPSTFVRVVYPTGDVVPMNLLRMYVEFSAPMSSGHSYEFVKLYAQGVGGDSLLEEPFFTGGGAVELWDPDHTRLTVLFDPGRIKRDLKPNEEMGLPLREGKRYRLVIDSAWRDAQGRPLVRSYAKEFRVGPQDRALIRTVDWRVTAPRVGTRDSLIVTFPEPLDRALLARLLSVRDSSGARIDGDIDVSARETRWAFAPRESWRRVPHALHVDTELEDLAGNNLRKLFDVAPGDAAATGVSATVVLLAFQPQ
jgi:hypothetical protein